MSKFKFYTPQEVADMLNVTLRTVYRYIKAEDLKANKVQGRWAIAEKDLEEFIYGKSK